jgi:hypothetical protein
VSFWGAINSLGTFAEDVGKVVPISSSSGEIIYAKISMAGITGRNEKNPRKPEKNDKGGRPT